MTMSNVSWFIFDAWPAAKSDDRCCMSRPRSFSRSSTPRSTRRTFQLAYQMLSSWVSARNVQGSKWHTVRLKLWHAPAFPGAVLGQLSVGLLCDRVGRKAALVATTLLIIVGAILGTAAHGANGSVQGLFWFLTVARGITGVVSVMTSCAVFLFLTQIGILRRASGESIPLLRRAPARPPMRKY